MTETPAETTPAGTSGPERCVVVVDRDLPPGLATNAAAVLALSVGARYPDLPGDDLVDADAGVHPGLIPMGLPVLAAPAATLAGLRAAALARDLFVVSFPTAGQQTTDYADFTQTVAATHPDDLTYLGLALCGAAKPVRRLTGGLPLLR
ncbi:DUF2000 domain-containing protein [Pseudokineococcus basanitobsidens]|uniref:DUF2000 domain-containing protein n=1 Tax=Pseudokineococcus basanitobsidens TaxID=1926649 RepID=A0ABU8RKJ8_9ACTN